MSLPLRPGDAYGDYRILEVLGRGSFSCVYKVGAPFLPRPMALKLSHEPVGSDAAAQRAVREMAILSSLTNPHVVRLHDSGLTPDGRAYLLMDWLEGQPLNDAHPVDEPMAPARAVGIIHQACLGLAEAHARGVVHRDLKPENLWLAPDGTVIVLDFGLARSWNHSTPAGAPATIGHMMVGTPHYTQPEQVNGGKLTPASDVYSLATLLYELLSGSTPFFGELSVSQARAQLEDDAIGWLKAHCLRPVVPITEHAHCTELPAALVDVLQASLSKTPEDRPRDAGELANALGRVLYHDLGVTSLAVVRVVHPYGGHEDRAIVPGSHRIGSDPHAELRLPAPDVPALAATLEWDGAPRQPVLRPNGPGVVVNDHYPIEEPVLLGLGDRVSIAGYRIEVVSLPGMGW